MKIAMTERERARLAPFSRHAADSISVEEHSFVSFASSSRTCTLNGAKSRVRSTTESYMNSTFGQRRRLGNSRVLCARVCGARQNFAESSF